ncbi:hypothetical protein V8F20_009307 [Naviculisporaceae sp. PSN 640]
MKDLGYVCLGCRIKLLASSTAQASRRVALARPRNQPLSRNQNHDKSQSRAFSSVARRLPIHGKERSIHYGRSWRNVQPAEDGQETPSISLFKSIVEAPGSSHGRPSIAAQEEEAPAGMSREAYYKLIKDAAKLHDIIQREKKSIAPAFAFFEQTLYPQLVEAGTIPLAVRNGACRELLTRLLDEKTQNFGSNALPTVTRISELTLQLGLLPPAGWGTLIMEMLQHIITTSTQPTDYSTIEEYTTATGRRDLLLHDLMGAWCVFCGFVSVETKFAPKSQPPVPTVGSEEYATSIANQISGKDEVQGETSQASTKTNKGKMGFQELLRQSHSIQTPKGGMSRPAIAAFATYQLLEDPVNKKRSVREEAGPFFNMLNKMLKISHFPSFKAMEPTLQAYPKLLHYLQWCTSKDGPKKRRQKRPVFTSKPPQGLSDSVHRQVGQAIRGRNLTALKRAWAEFWGEAPVPEPDRILELRKSNSTFDYFILAYMGMRQHQLAVDVWSHMEHIGIAPTVKTWNSMIQGCANAKDPDGIKTVWQKLVATGLRLDTAIWTARIDGLITSGDPDSGLRALEEMVQVWNNSQLKTKESKQYGAIAVRPTIEPVNAALAGLLRLERSSTAKNLLAWAVQQGIKPDIFTFNTLLRPLVRQGHMGKVDDLIRTMSAANVQADAATYTILFDGALANLGSEAPEKQVELVTKIIAQMEAAGIEVNMQMYAKMIYLFLQEGERAEMPVKAILSHIWAGGLELTSHIYTMLAEHYFSRNPPDSNAVTALIENRQLHANKGIDRVFWERVIKGYCQVGETERAHEIFDKVFASGTTITFSTLYEFLLALINSGDMDAARKLVIAARDIKEADELGRDAGKTRFWKHRFWHLVDQYGLLDAELVAPFLAATANPL